MDDLKALKDEYFKALGSTLSSERTHQGLDQADLVPLTGLSAGTISDLERGKNRSHSSAYLYALGLGVSWTVLVQRAEALADSRRAQAGKPSILEAAREARLKQQNLDEP